MERIRALINQHAIAFLTIIFGVVVLLSSCDSVDDEDLNQLLQAEGTAEETPTTPETAEQVPVDEPVALEAGTFTIDAMNREAWAYFSFASGAVVEVEDATNSEAWDIGFQRTQVKLNGGISGPGMGSVVMLTEKLLRW